MSEMKRPAPSPKGRRPEGKHDERIDTPARPIGQRLSDELRDLAHAVRRSGCGYRTDPETILIAKDTVAARLTALARSIGGAP